MFLVDNFISFHDLSPDGCFLWASSSITACLGYEPEEIIGIPAYDVIHSDDIAYVKVTHQENVLNEMVGTQVILRFKHKNGTFIPCMVIFSLCYDYIVTCSTVIDQAEGTIRKLSAHSAAMTSLVGSKEQEFERIKRHHKAFGINTWNPNGLDPEPRACMILNRFSRNLGIMYASPSCELIFKLEPDEIVGRPFLLFIRSDDLATFVEQVDLAKSTNAVTHMRFWFQSPHCQREIPCEAMLFGAADGMIAIMRRIRNLDREHSRLRPLTSLQQDDPSIVDGTTPLPEAYRMRTHHIQELDLDDDDDDDEDNDDNEQNGAVEEDDHGNEFAHGQAHRREYYPDRVYGLEYPYRPVRADVGHIDMDAVDDSGLDMELEELDLDSEPRAQLVEIEDDEDIEELEMPRSTRYPERDRDRPGNNGPGFR
ncbi:hypothetical protein BGZ72_007242 [Mortierella alpina]|nr:hypothetical protein BGZ72_007242 [Mortierella alpina]